MREHRWRVIGNLGLGSCLLAGCLRATLPPEGPRSQANLSAPAAAAAEASKTPQQSSDYLVSSVSRDPQRSADQRALLRVAANPQAEKPVEPAEMRIQPPQPSPPRPVDPPQPRMEVQAAPLTCPEVPSVHILRQLLERRPEEEIHEQLKSYDPASRDAMLMLLTSIAQLEQGGGLARISPRDLAAWTARLNTMTASLRGRSQLILERMCFCSHIKNFGNFAPLPPEHTFFQPGEEAVVYVQARNLSNRRQEDRYVTVLKGRVEIYDETNRKNPPIAWTNPPIVDDSASPRQDFFINFHVQMPLSCPAGLYTMRITVEDWTDAAPGAKQVPPWRIAQRTLDFRVGGPVARRARRRIAGISSQP